MSSLSNFLTNLSIADKYVALHREMRQCRGLGQRGALTEAHVDLYWLLRSGIVTVSSALDTYIHERILEDVEDKIASGNPTLGIIKLITDATSESGDMQVLDIITKYQSNPEKSTLVRMLKDRHSKITYQAPDKIKNIFRALGYDDCFETINLGWQKMKSASVIESKLTRLYKRRNQIAHESDIDHEIPRSITVKYVNDQISFIRALCTKLDDLR